MKRYILFTLSLLFALLGQAQKTKTFVFHHKGQNVLSVPVSQVDSIVFVEEFDEDQKDSIPDIPKPNVDCDPVDLGLSVKWAPFNIDATKPEEFGGYYTFGALNTQETYDETGLLNERRNLTYEEREVMDNLPDISGSAIDVATKKWGGLWRIPTWKEWQELCGECTWEWTTLNEVNGMKVTGPNGNSIFLPATGFMDDTSYYGEGDGLRRSGEFAAYSTSYTISKGWGSLGGVCGMYFKSGFRECTADDLHRYMSATWYGRVVRPVYGEYTEPEDFVDERRGLMNLYESTTYNGNGFEWNWKHWDNWDTETMLGDWYGVETNEKGHVVGINLEDNGLSGFHLNNPEGYGYWVQGGVLPYIQHVNINHNPGTSYKGIGIKGVQIQDLVLDSVGFYVNDYKFEGVTNLTIQNSPSQFFYVVGDFENLVVRNIHAEPWDWHWEDDSDMPFVLKEGTAKKIVVEDCNLETDVITVCDEFVIRNTKVEHYSYSSQQTDEGTTKPSKWKTQIAKRFMCKNCVLIVNDLDYDDFCEGCEMVFENVTLVLKNGTQLTNFSATFTNSQANWKQYMK